VRVQEVFGINHDSQTIVNNTDGAIDVEWMGGERKEDALSGEGVKISGDGGRVATNGGDLKR
jgi:hypothetical protein